MNLREMYQIIANQYNVSVEEVEREIKAAIADTVTDGNVPTVEEFIEKALLEMED